MSLSNSPKIELHLHLEGAAPPEFIRRLADEKKIKLDGVFTEQGNYAYRDFPHFLQVYEAATGVLKSPEDYARLVRAVLEQSAAHGVVYSETFISPDFCGGGDLGAWREYLAAIKEAADQAEVRDGIILRGIITPIRHFGPDRAKPIAICAAETVGDFITGFGIAGDEMSGKPVDFAYSFDMAREAGLRLTAHAGEWGGAQSIWDALRDLKVERIGHGVHAINDPELVEHLAETGVVLEVCPGSNVVLGVYPDWQSHPIERLREKGVKVTVSTDDPPFFGTTMSHEYDRLADTFGWDEEIFAEITKTALEAAFCDAETRARVAKRLEPLT
ncbi:MAG: adenosine deaminase [Paracoccaceae bacterium]|jgi:adenosine deaminase